MNHNPPPLNDEAELYHKVMQEEDTLKGMNAELLLALAIIIFLRKSH